MAWQNVAAGVLTAGASIGGNLIAANQNKKAQNRQNNFNKEMWMLENEYNTPENQMKRLKDAGLNPHLVYGNGSVANTSGSSPRSASYTPFPADIGSNAAGSALMAYQDMRIKSAQVDNIEAQTENIRARTITEGFRSFLTDLLGQEQAVKTRVTGNMESYQYGAADQALRQGGLNLDKTFAEITGMNLDQISKRLDIQAKRQGLTQQQIQTEIQQAELLYKTMQNEWMKMGVTTSDNPILRVVVRMMNEAGIKDWPSLVKAVKSIFE